MRKFVLVIIAFSSFTHSLYAQNFLRDISVSTRDRVDTFEKGRVEIEVELIDGALGAPILRETPIKTIIVGDSIGPNGATSISVEKAIDNNYVLYRDVVRRYTWIEGLGEPITQEVASHLPFYYRFSMQNEAGHYQLIEAMHGDSLTTAHSMGTYILDPSDEVPIQNQAWKDRLNSVGQWLLFSDLSGQHLIEERAYEAKSKDANLVYVMQSVYNDESHVTISYLDSWGYPADMNEDDTYTYGSVAYVTYDEQGRDAIVDFLDGEGYRKKNTNGVDQTRYQYDDKDRIILKTSNNCVGDFAIDNWGNCGVRYIYHDTDDSYTVICVDNNLKPVRMPALRANVEDTYIRCDYRKDKWGRISEAVVLTDNGDDDATLSGIHRVTFSYSSSGDLIGKSYYDLEGRRIENK